MAARHKALALSLTSWMPLRTRARWLTTLFELDKIFRLGKFEPWLIERARTPTEGIGLVKMVPFFLRIRLYSLAYILNLHRKGHVLPGVWKVLGCNDGTNLVTAGLPKDAFPDWLLGDLLRIGDIEPELFPNEALFSKFVGWSGDFDPSVGRQYKSSVLSLSKRKFDVIVLAPWIRAGGADKGLIQYLEYYARAFDSVLLLTTYPAPSTRLEQVPAGVDVLEIGLQWKYLLPGDQVLLLARILLQFEPKYIHNVLSELGWKVFLRHGLALKSSRAKLLVSLFTEERDPDGRRVGYPADYLPKCRNVVDVLITDNQPWATWFAEHYALSETLVEPVHFYTTLGALRPKREGTGSPPSKGKVLWAGRICPQKTPEVLLQVVRLLSDVEFHVFGPVEDSSHAVARALRKEPNVRMHGEFRSFSDISQHDNFDCLLYTTSFDGMPNVILEAAADELPVVAPSYVGGLSDLLDESTCFVVSDHNDPACFADAIQALLRNTAVARERAIEAKRRLEEQFSRDNFMRQMDVLFQKLL